MNYRKMRAGAQNQYRQWLRDFKAAYGRDPLPAERMEALLCARAKVKPTWYEEVEAKKVA